MTELLTIEECSTDWLLFLFCQQRFGLQAIWIVRPFDRGFITQESTLIAWSQKKARAQMAELR